MGANCIRSVSRGRAAEARVAAPRPRDAAAGLPSSGLRAAVVAAWIGLLLAGAAGAQGGPAGRPLGQLIPTAPPGTLLLRVGLEKVSGPQATAVPLDHVFQSGDHFRISVKASRAGYLCLLYRGASGGAGRSRLLFHRRARRARHGHPRI